MQTNKSRDTDYDDRQERRVISGIMISKDTISSKDALDYG